MWSLRKKSKKGEIMRYPNPAGYTGPVANSARYGQVKVPFALPETAASPTASITANSVPAVAATFTGFTTAAAASQVFTIVSNLFHTTTNYQVTVSNTGTNDAHMTLVRVNPLAGSVAITVTNNGAAALNGNVTIIVSIVPPYVV